MMTGDEPTGYFSLRTMVPAGIAVWAGAFWLIHGPMVFAYLLLHGATTGVFLTAVYLSDRRRAVRPSLPRVLRQSGPHAREHQRSAAGQTVAS